MMNASRHSTSSWSRWMVLMSATKSSFLRQQIDLMSLTQRYYDPDASIGKWSWGYPIARAEKEFSAFTAKSYAWVPAWIYRQFLARQQVLVEPTWQIYAMNLR